VIIMNSYEVQLRDVIDRIECKKPIIDLIKAIGGHVCIILGTTIRRVSAGNMNLYEVELRYVLKRI
jgi:hypothetical protein